MKREMPPWYIDKNIGIAEFKDDPSLSDAEIATIGKWVDAGAPMGNPADMPPPRQFSDVDQWHIGKPDVIVTMKKPYILPAHGPDNIVDVLVDPGFTEDMYVMAVESKPADARSFKVVHHFYAQTRSAPHAPRKHSPQPLVGSKRALSRAAYL